MSMYALALSLSAYPAPDARCSSSPIVPRIIRDNVFSRLHSIQIVHRAYLAIFTTLCPILIKILTRSAIPRVKFLLLGTFPRQMIPTLSNVVASYKKRSGCLTAPTRIKRDDGSTEGEGETIIVRRNAHQYGVRGFFTREAVDGTVLGSVDHIFVRIVASSSRGITRKIDRTYLPKPNYTSVHPLSLS